MPRTDSCLTALPTEFLFAQGIQMAKIVVKDLNKYYTIASRRYNANFEAEDKEFIVLVGPSGCGASTVLR